jgi:type I restriction enzyme R subunit
MKPEEKARREIDNQLQKADWTIQDRSNINLGTTPGVAIREFPTNAGPVDYALFADRKAIGVVEAKPTGSTGST